VTEELDALQTMALDPVAFLVVPKIPGDGDDAALPHHLGGPDGGLGRQFIGVAGGGFTFGGYMLATRDALLLRDIISGVIKSLVFGMVITAVGCQEGFSTGSGAEEVGRSTTSGSGNLHSAGDPDRSCLYGPVLSGAGRKLENMAASGSHDPIISARDLRVSLCRSGGSAWPHIRCAARRDAGRDRRLRLG